jgi:hypothetical protein
MMETDIFEPYNIDSARAAGVRVLGINTTAHVTNVSRGESFQFTCRRTTDNPTSKPSRTWLRMRCSVREPSDRRVVSLITIP